MHDDNQPIIRVFGEVTDSTANGRLVLNFVEVPLPNAQPRQKAYDFYSLIWEIKDGEAWTPAATISRDDFQRGAEHRRWISRIHSLSTDDGYAIIQVGEEGPGSESGVVRATYSWRKWDLVNNVEISILKICDSPKDTFDESNGSI